MQVGGEEKGMKRDFPGHETKIGANYASALLT